MKRILLIGYNYAPEPTGIGKYSGEMMQWLAQHGYDCTVITAYPYYPYWKVQSPYDKRKLWYQTEKQEFGSGGKLSVHRCPMYVPSQPSGLKRIILDLTFLVTAFFKLLQLLPGKKFDYVFTVVPSFQFGLLGILYKKLRNAKLFYHIQDMQIEAARDLKMIKSEKLIKTLFKVEQYIFNQCDTITCVGEGMVRKTQEKTSKVVSLFPNWADNSLFYPLDNKAVLKKEIGYQPDDKIILYSGAIGEKQGLEMILHAAKALEYKPKWKFLICGSGPYKKMLRTLAEDLNLKNVKFCSLQPIATFNNFLNAADLHLVIQKANACDLVMPSKLTTILAVGGLALVTANQGTGLHSVIDRHQIGLLTEAENIEAFINNISNALEQDNEPIKRNAKFFADIFLSIDGIMRTFESVCMLKEAPQEAVIRPETVPLPLPAFQLDRSAWKRVNGRLSNPVHNPIRTKAL